MTGWWILRNFILRCAKHIYWEKKILKIIFLQNRIFLLLIGDKNSKWFNGTWPSYTYTGMAGYIARAPWIDHLRYYRYIYLTQERRIDVVLSRHVKFNMSTVIILNKKKIKNKNIIIRKKIRWNYFSYFYFQVFYPIHTY